MPNQPESKLSRRIIQELNKLPGVWAIKIHVSSFQVAGVPDILVCARGRFFGLETKMPGQEHKLRPRQAYVHELIRAADGVVAVVSSVPEALDVVRWSLPSADEPTALSEPPAQPQTPSPLLEGIASTSGQPGPSGRRARPRIRTLRKGGVE